MNAHLTKEAMEARGNMDWLSGEIASVQKNTGCEYHIAVNAVFQDQQLEKFKTLAASFLGTTPEKLFVGSEDSPASAHKKRMDEMAGAVALAQSKSGSSYESAWNRIRADLRFKDLVTNIK